MPFLLISVFCHIKTARAIATKFHLVINKIPEYLFSISP